MEINNWKIQWSIAGVSYEQTFDNLSEFQTKHNELLVLLNDSSTQFETITFSSGSNNG